MGVLVGVRVAVIVGVLVGVPGIGVGVRVAVGLDITSGAKVTLLLQASIMTPTKTINIRKMEKARNFISNSAITYMVDVYLGKSISQDMQSLEPFFEQLKAILRVNRTHIRSFATGDLQHDRRFDRVAVCIQANDTRHT